MVLVTADVVGVARVGTTTTTPPSGAKAMPRNSVFAEGVFREVTVAVTVELYPEASVTVQKLVGAVAYSVTVEPETEPAMPLTAAAAMVPLAVHVPETREYFWIVPASMATYTVSTPAEPSRSAKKNWFALPDVGSPVSGEAVVAVVGSPVPTAVTRVLLPEALLAYS